MGLLEEMRDEISALAEVDNEEEDGRNVRFSPDGPNGDQQKVDEVGR